MELGLSGKRALVSGSTAGIGYAAARALAAEGAQVILNGRTQARVHQAVTRLKTEVPGALVSGIAQDLGNAEGCQALFHQLPDVDVLVNNLGIFEPKAFEAIADADWLRFFEVNVLSGVRLSRQYLAGMRTRNWGRVVFVSSASALQIPAEMIHYGMTKTAQLSISRGLAQLTRGTNVTVNTIMPGPTKSRGVGDFLEQLAKGGNSSADEVEKAFFRDGRPSSLLQRFASVDEIATTVAYFASPLSSATNGAAIRADGGIVNSIV